MTPADLKTLIQGDSTALGLFNGHHDYDCAQYCMTIAPKVTVETRGSRQFILSLFESSPADGITVLTTIDTVAESNPVVAEIKKFMGPGEHPQCLPDWSLAPIRAALTASVQAGGLGLSDALAGPILRASERPQTITAADVEFVRNNL
jgi:hypothetical protein